MAGGQERILRGRIRSIQATKKITRAMELIAASRIVKAQQRVAAAVPYSEKITDVVRDLAAAGAGLDAPLLAGHDQVATTCYVAITADRGLCGGYNAGVQRATEGEVKADVVAGRQYRIVPVGRKGFGYFHFRGYQLGETFAGFSDTPKLEDAKRIASLRDRAVHQRCGRQGRARVHPLRVGRQPGGRAAPARAARRRDGDWRRRPTGTGRGAPGRLRVRARSLGDLRRPAARYVEARRLRRPAQRRGVASTPSASGR